MWDVEKIIWLFLQALCKFCLEEKCLNFVLA